MKSTLQEVARKARVSPATASRVLSNSSYGVSELLRERVIAAAEELRYVPNEHARSLVLSKTSIVGVIVHDVSDPYFAEIVRGLQDAASKCERLVTICNSYRDPERELQYFKLLRAQQVDAIILAGSGLEDREYSERITSQIEAFESAGGHVSLIGRHHEVGDSVEPDNEGGARELARLLVKLGHDDFGVISGPPLITTTADRMSGFRQGLSEAGITLAQEHIIESNFTRDGGYEATLQLIEQDPQFSAIFALNDQMAVGALAALRESNVRVPEQISVVGFDDLPIARDVNPELTTVRLPMVRMGELAMKLALRTLDSKVHVEHLPAEVIIRASTARGPHS